jgi:CSLREA domain-containing protein
MIPPGFRVASVLALVLASIAAAPSASSGGNQITVTKTADTNDGTCDIDCSLREAIIWANAMADIYVIHVPAGTYVLDLIGAGESFAATGDLDLRDDVYITGAGPGKTILDGNLTDRVFDVAAGHGATIADVTIRRGRVTDTGGGAISNGGSLTLYRTVLSNNADIGTSNSSVGGAVINRSLGSITIVNTTISANSALRGGGLFVAGSSKANLTGVTISQNSAGVGGGVVSYGTFSASATTLTGNAASINIAAFAGSGGVATFAYSTIAMNTEPGTVGAIRGSSSTVPSLIGTIVSNNSGRNCGTTVSTQGYNVEDTDTCGFSDPTDRPNTDPMLGSLAANGGPTKTMALAKGSLALDMGGADCGNDQRGVPRPQGASCDAGSYELALCASEPVNIVGTISPDTLFGTTGADVFLALAGADVVSGGDGDDLVCGGAGTDTLKGQGGNDTLNGGSNSDTCDGGPGAADKAYACETQLHIP